MDSKSTSHKSSSPVDSGSRRSSGRVRKPTAKAQALDGGKPYSPPLSDTIVVSSPSPPKNRSRRKDSSTTPAPTIESSQEASVGPHIPETPATIQVNNITPPPKTEEVNDEAETRATESPPRRVSQRERKPTAKALLTSPTAQKRPLGAIDAQDAPVRKSARISYGGARVPSKLRYSVSSTHDEPDEADQAVTAQTPPDKKSKVVVLKTTPTKEDDARDAEIPETPINNSKVVVLKSKRFSEIVDPASQHDEVGAKKPPRKKAKRQPKADQTITVPTIVAPEEPKAPAPATAPARAQSYAQAPCNLSCLPPWSRIVAFAEIVKQMPDTDDADEEFVPGGPQDWRAYANQFCQCMPIPPLPTHETSPTELAWALQPNTVFQGTEIDPIDLTEPAAVAESELLSQPVNTILRATDAERLSQLFASPNNMDAVQRTRRYTTPAAGSLLNSNVTGNLHHANELATPLTNGSMQRRVSFVENGNVTFVQPAPSSEPTRKRTYEHRLRDDHMVLSQIRKRASAVGIQWSFNMTFDDIQALLAEVEDRQEGDEWYYHQEGVGPDHGMPGHSYQISDENGASPRGFGVLYPTRRASSIVSQPQYTQPFQQPRENSPYQPLYAQRQQSLPPQKQNQSENTGRKRQQKDTWINYSPVNRTPPELLSQRLASPTTTSSVTFVDDYDPVTSTSNSTLEARRLSSPSRLKSSRFRVDPRGLLGESPGPGTIINIDKRKTSGRRDSGASAGTGSGSGRPVRRSRSRKD
ncbi:hypothetical protein A1O1_01335 [Capronia coronata CBS 617.96]|uniref:Uncharacterized protein n=1 Tax=Capronia coronata CBS 617.96 TaxID=1182541 RepID=W9ZNY1_9EURO|nr:uncharacterized protein A1O1_01335 [Capronia coronata CBS 617.96]EXJ96209.1 hypothetical protein A1O1_01335 [Capronia coronata CBS 617.96]